MLGNVTDYIAYAMARGVAINVADAGVQLVKATDFLNALRWVGKPLDEWQEDCWPRSGVDYCGSPLMTETGEPIEVAPGVPIQTNVVPRGVIFAAYRLAMEVAGGVEIMPTVAGGKKIIEERIEGALTMKYSEGSLYDVPDFPWLNAMIDRFIDHSASSRVTFAIRRG